MLSDDMDVPKFLTRQVFVGKPIVIQPKPRYASGSVDDILAEQEKAARNLKDVLSDDEALERMKNSERLKAEGYVQTFFS